MVFGMACQMVGSAGRKTSEAPFHMLRVCTGRKNTIKMTAEQRTTLEAQTIFGLCARV